MSRIDPSPDLSYSFRDKSLLCIALTHSSFTREQNLPHSSSNERLEFIGDGFLDAIIGQELYQVLPNVKEGVLSKLRARIVCESALAKVARTLELGGFLCLGKGEERTGGRNRESILANTVEAIIGAIYLDGGYDNARKWVLENFAGRIEEALNGEHQSDYKSQLQEKLQSQGPVRIAYVLTKQEGPDHDKTFYVKVTVNGNSCGHGTGKSKKEAEQQAAKYAMEKGFMNVL